MYYPRVLRTHRVTNWDHLRSTTQHLTGDTRNLTTAISIALLSSTDVVDDSCEVPYSIPHAPKFSSCPTKSSTYGRTYKCRGRLDHIQENQLLRHTLRLRRHLWHHFCGPLDTQLPLPNTWHTVKSLRSSSAVKQSVASLAIATGTCVSATVERLAGQFSV